MKEHIQEHNELYVTYQLRKQNFPVLSFKTADGLNAHAFVIEVLDPECKATRKTLGFPAIRKMTRCYKGTNPVPLIEHHSRVNDWNMLAKKGELFWHPLPDERKPNEKCRLPGVFVVKSKNSVQEIKYADEISNLKIMNPDDLGGRGIQMG